MTSELKVRANRANALASTGPRTVEGRLVSRGNALKHGLRSADVVVQVGPFCESAEEYETLFASLQEALQPEGALESALVETVAACLWRKRRVLRFERGTIERQLLASRLDQAVQRAMPHAPKTEHPAMDEPAALLRTADGIRRLLQVLGDVRLRVGRDGSLSPEDKARLFDSFGSNRDGVAMLCAVHGSMADDARDESKPHLKPASWHIERVIAALDGETARLQVLLPEIEQLEREAKEAERAQAMVPGEAALNKVMRHEAHLDRQLYRALNQLERLQRQRLGDVVLPPVQLDVTLT